MEDEAFAEILQGLPRIRITDRDVETIDLDQEALDAAALWTANCCYGIISVKEIYFQSLSSTLDRVWVYSPFQMKMVQEGIYKFHFQFKAGMTGLIARSPWHLDNYLLMLIQGSTKTIPQAIDFEWFES